MTRIVYIAGKDPLEETMGGHSSYVRAHARAASKLGYEPHIFGVGREAGVVEKDYGIFHRVRSPFWWIPHGDGTGYRSPWNPVHAATVINAVAKFIHSTSDVEILHSFGWWCYTGVIARKRLAMYKRRVIAISSAYSTMHHESKAKCKQLTIRLDPLKWLFQKIEHGWAIAALSPMERYGLIHSDHVLCNYKSVRELIIALGVPGERTQEVSYTSEQAFFDELQGGTNCNRTVAGKQRSLPHLVSLSRHDPRKGLDVLLYALAELQRRNIPYRATLLSGGALLATHRKLARTLGLTEHVNITGKVSDPYPYLHDADIFVLPSVEEGSSSLSLLEAMQAGCAIIATSIDGIPEDVSDGKQALLVRPGNVNDLTASLERMLCDETLRRRLGQAARRNFEQCYLPARFIDELGTVYRSLTDTVSNSFERHLSMAAK